LFAIRKNFLNEIGPLNPEYDGAQDYDLVLRATEHTKRIHHIPKVLYHWRMTENSTAKDVNVKPYAKTAGLRALQAHLDRVGIDAKAVDAEFPTTYNLDFPDTPDAPLISIVIPNKDSAEMLNNCITSIIEKTTYSNYEIIVVENNSTDPKTFTNYDCLQAADARIKVVYHDGDFNFSKIVNLGVANSNGEYIVLLNNDTEVITPEWLTRMQGYCKCDGVGVVGAKLLYRDGVVQHAGVAITNAGPVHINLYCPYRATGYLYSVALAQDYSAVTGACMMIARSIYEKVSGYSEQFAIAFNDIDFCLKVRELGLRIVFDANTMLYHDESVSRGYDYTTTDKKIRLSVETRLLMETWPMYFAEGDPCINPQFTKNGTFKVNFTI
jgi:GT2 family glycosyltransferase